MVLIDLRFFVLLIIVDAVNTAMISFTCFTFMHVMALGAVWAHYIPEILLCLKIIFAIFVAARNAQIVITVTYMLAYFKFSVQ